LHDVLYVLLCVCALVGSEKYYEFANWPVNFDLTQTWKQTKLEKLNIRGTLKMN